MITETDSISRLLNERNKALNQIEVLIARVALLEARLSYVHLAVGEVREHSGSLVVIGALHPQIELDVLPIGTPVYIKLARQ